ncbi:MAG: alpha/beta hydrolase [Gemmataceae bacterium]
MSRLAIWLVGAILLSAGCSSLERGLVYYPVRSPRKSLPPDAPVKDVYLTSRDNNLIHARWAPHPDSKGALLLCHGNAGNLEHRGELVHKLWSTQKLSVLIFDYPGYGQSTGEPSEEGCFASARAAYEWLSKTQNVDPSEIVICGQSLGGAVAVQLASERPHKALVLVRTFTSIPDVARANSIFGSVAAPIMSERFASFEAIQKCRRPVFFAQADKDELIPFHHTERLQQSLPESVPRVMHVLRGLGHNDPLPADFYATLREFLNDVDASVTN